MASTASPAPAPGTRPKRLMSIRRAFTQLLVLGVTLPALLIWAVGHWTADTAVNEMWEQLAEELAGHAVQRTLRYVETGEAALETNNALGKLDLVDPSKRKEILKFLVEGLRAHPNVTWFTYAGTDGAYLSAYHPATGGLRVTWREQVEGGARYRDFMVARDDTWEALPEKVAEYDPRTRSWFKSASGHTRAVWSKPFLFASGPPGFIVSRATRDEMGTVTGVWAVEYEMAYVSEFLAGLNVGKTGRAYLMTNEGEMIGHPESECDFGTIDGLLVSESEGKKCIARAQGNKDVWLTHAFAETNARLGVGDHHLKFEIDGERFLVASMPFPRERGLPWKLLMVIPEEDILGTIHKNAMLSGLAALAIAALVLGFGIWYANKRISQPLADIAKDLDSMARLDVQGAPRLDSSRLEEIHGMVEARERMRGGLTSFTKYVPAQLVRDLLQEGLEARLGGESKPLTIMFSDVVGFTAISEQLGEPQALVDALGEYLEAMSATIAECGGTVDKYIGDAVMAFWGAPRPLPDHAVQAVRAAWRCQERLDALRAKWPASHPAFFTRIGLHTGEVVVGNIGWEDRMNYTVMGDAVNLASRLEALCQRYGIFISLSEDTYNAARSEFLARPVDCVAVKGKEKPVVVYELLGPRAGCIPGHAQVLRGDDDGLRVLSIARLRRRDRRLRRGPLHSHRRCGRDTAPGALPRLCGRAAPRGLDRCPQDDVEVAPRGPGLMRAELGDDVATEHASDLEREAAVLVEELLELGLRPAHDLRRRGGDHVGTRLVAREEAHLAHELAPLEACEHLVALAHLCLAVAEYHHVMHDRAVLDERFARRRVAPVADAQQLDELAGGQVAEDVVVEFALGPLEIAGPALLHEQEDLEDVHEREHPLPGDRRPERCLGAAEVVGHQDEDGHDGQDAQPEDVTEQVGDQIEDVGDVDEIQDAGGPVDEGEQLGHGRSSRRGRRLPIAPPPERRVAYR